MKRSQRFMQTILSSFIELSTGRTVSDLPTDEQLIDFCPSPCAGLPSFQQRPPSFMRQMRARRELLVQQTLAKRQSKTRQPKESTKSSTKKPKSSKAREEVLQGISHLPAATQALLLKQLRL